MSTWTAEEENDIRRRWIAGETLVRISAACGRKRDTIRRKLRSMGLDFSHWGGGNYQPEPWSDEETELLVKLWDNPRFGMSAIAAKLGRRRNSIKAKVARLGLPARPIPAHLAPHIEAVGAPVDDSAYVDHLNAQGGFPAFGEVYRNGGEGPGGITPSKDWRLLPVQADRVAA